MKAIYFFRSKNVVVYSFLLWVFIFSNGCGNDTEIPASDCSLMDNEIDTVKKVYLGSPNASNCQNVVKAYDNYIDGKCDDAASYVNLRDAFKKDHCP